jgi:N-acetylneuraminate synthase/N,N'-diacetyllegionaminate synthase
MIIKIGDKLIGDGLPCFIIAEAGVNHNGDVNLAKKLIDVAKAAGADAVKFQTFKAENVVTKNYPQYEMLKKLELSEDDFRELAEYSKEKNIIFLSSPFCIDSVDLLDKIGVPAFKIASGEITNLPLLKYVSSKGKPIILSTGMATLGEIEDALENIRSNGVKDVILLHCITSYPTKIEDINLKAIQTLKCAFKLPVGFSDHTREIIVPVAAAALGACVVEKHLTLDRKMPGPDHKASLEPHEFKEMVKAIRDIEKALGDGIKKPTEEEERIKKVVRRSIVAKVNISKGSTITKEMIALKRPGTGICPKYYNRIIGKKATRNIEADELINWDDVK